MIQASSYFSAQLRDIHVEPAFERRFRVLLEYCRRNLPAVDEDFVRRAFGVAYWAHRDDRRASGERYISHPLEVATIVARDVPFDDVSVIAALLHDTVEDTDLSLELVEAEFGQGMAQIIDGLTKIDHVFASRDLGQAENVRKLMLSMASDIRVIIVKFADRLHNMRTLGSLSQRRQLKIATETHDLFVPLAHRFGLNKVKTELEDLCLKYLQPDAYRAIANGLDKTRKQREAHVEQFIEPVEAELEDAGFAFSIYGRPKSISSIHRKMQVQQKELDEIYDLFAVRVVLKGEGKKGREDCWRVYSILADLYKPIPERFRDFISVPKSNGYQSLHTTVIGPDGRPVEIQIRTEEMHAVAERGVAAHWKYKEEGGGDGVAAKVRSDEALEQIYAWVRELMETPASDRAIDFVKDFQLSLYDEEIYVFTPRGDVMTLPRDATPVDFAFQVHSEVGFHCIGAKVNGRMVPLSYRLTSGDQVQILTSNKQKPNPDWMQFVVTHKARTRIRHWIRERRRKTAEHGRDLLERKLKRAKLEIDEDDLNRLSSKLKFPNTQQLFYEIGSGLYDPADFVRFVKEGHRSEEQAAASTEDTPLRLQVTEFTETAREEGRAALVIDGEHHADLATQYATCCNPIPGDDVFGFVSKTGTINIHRTNCRNAPHLLMDHADRVIPVEWSRQKDVQFISALRLVGEDRVGMVSDLTTVISKNLKTNIRSITIESEDGVFEGTIVLLVSDLKHLQRLMQRLGRVEGIYGVYRFENDHPS
ncbi:MAG: bifunctional (p)ppGpp synthetase/guanosine-3',5'-bis(diphosphate) 3'-pyrophosphohydrolase [Bacteroidota bacterium]